MFNIALCDDNTQFLNLLEGKIRKECASLVPEKLECFIGPSFGSAEDVLLYIKSNPIDVLFLDIDMPKMNGFELAKILCKEYKDTIIVFMSAYDNFVYDSFEFSPFAYLRKNCMVDELPKLLTRVIEKLLEPTKQLTLVTKEGNFSFYVKDILYFESKHNNYIVHCNNMRSYECRGTLSQVEEAVTRFSFYRIHSAFLVNIEHVDRIIDNAYVSINGKLLPLAQRRIVEFRKKYTEYTRRSLGI